MHHNAILLERLAAEHQAELSRKAERYRRDQRLLDEARDADKGQQRGFWLILRRALSAAEGRG